MVVSLELLNSAWPNQTQRQSTQPNHSIRFDSIQSFNRSHTINKHGGMDTCGETRAGEIEWPMWEGIDDPILDLLTANSPRKGQVQANSQRVEHLRQMKLIRLIRSTRLTSVKRRLEGLTKQLATILLLCASSEGFACRI